MTAVLLDGKKVASEIRKKVSEKAAGLKARGVTPGLAVILVGDDPASKVYVGQKEKACHEVGFTSTMVRLPERTTQAELL